MPSQAGKCACEETDQAGKSNIVLNKVRGQVVPEYNQPGDAGWPATGGDGVRASWLVCRLPFLLLPLLLLDLLQHSSRAGHLSAQVVCRRRQVRHGRRSAAAAAAAAGSAAGGRRISCAR